MQLASRKQSAKLLLYRRFAYVLLIEVVISVAWVRLAWPPRTPGSTCWSRPIPADLSRGGSPCLLRQVVWQIMFILGDALDTRWASLWLFDAFWHMLYLAVLLSITWLWSPSVNNLQYAYMDELSASLEEEHEDDEGSDAHESGTALKGP